MVCEIVERGGRVAPKVGWKSVRRAGCRVGEYTEGAWKLQIMLGNMSVWKTWVPNEGA